MKVADTQTIRERAVEHVSYKLAGNETHQQLFYKGLNKEGWDDLAKCAFEAVIDILMEPDEGMQHEGALRICMSREMGDDYYFAAKESLQAMLRRAAGRGENGSDA
jgi:hypothetical protein